MASGTDGSGQVDSILELSKITLRFGATTALDDVNINIRAGEFFTLLGPSGCGKTSLLRLLAGLQIPTSGHIRLDGQDITGVPPHRRPVNTVFQSYALFPHLTVARNVAFGLEMLRWQAAAIQKRIPEVLSLVGLSSYGERRTEQLSGGQQQRVALARALAPRPRVLLLDEPMSALDLKLRKETQQELKRLHREAGITFVLVTHDQEEALTLSDRIAVMKDGRVRQIGSPEVIYREPSDTFVADFIGEANLIQASALGRAGVAGLVMVRPEDIAIAPESDAARVRGTISDMRFLGGTVELTVVTDAGNAIRTRSAGAAAVLNHGQAVGRRVGLVWPDRAERVLEG
ncbi:ABC transporter ATP-binding protein [Kaistia dalseonensis]|nr:ABC transporter ATP-binding protein [Kaistia dalseonensis]MCX5493365.1 ABC transporter ATP-binding protein [Kaistia dalseonensis]